MHLPLLMDLCGYMRLPLWPMTNKSPLSDALRSYVALAAAPGCVSSACCTPASLADCGFNRSMQRFDGIVQPAYRSLVLCAPCRVVMDIRMWFRPTHRI